MTWFQDKDGRKSPFRVVAVSGSAGIIISLIVGYFVSMMTGTDPGATATNALTFSLTSLIGAYAVKSGAERIGK